MIQSLVRDFFQQLYTVGQLIGSGDDVRLIRRLVTDEINATLLAPILNDEIKKAVFELGSTKAPSPNGFSGSFYQSN